MTAKIVFSSEQLDLIRSMFEQNMTSAAIAKHFNCSRKIISRTFKVLAIDATDRKRRRKVCNRTEYSCKDCHIIKPIEFFQKHITGDRVHHNTSCKECTKTLSRDKKNKRD